MTRKSAALACLFLVVILSTSCVRIVEPSKASDEPSVPQGALEVYSAYPGLQYLMPGEFQLENRPNYDMPWTNVAVLNGRLSVYGEDRDGEYGQNIVKAGQDFQCFWLRGDSTGVYVFQQSTQRERLLVDEYCLGILHANNWCLFFTESNGYPNPQLSIRGFVADHETENHRVSEPLIVDGSAYLFAASWTINYELDTPKVVYLVSDDNFTELRINTSKPMDDQLSNITVIEHELPDWWVKAAEKRELWFTNMVLMEDGTVYIGERCGVIGVKDGVFTYYPINYQEAMQES